MVGVYFVISTIATAGFGDVSAVNDGSLLSAVEKVLALVLIVFGVGIYTNAISMASEFFTDPM